MDPEASGELSLGDSFINEYVAKHKQELAILRDKA
jgi:hypothetical protein